MKMMFLYLYPLVGFISLSGFIPQIKALLTAVTPPVNISISSWFLWTFASAITLGYGIYVLQDKMFCIVTGIGFVLNSFVLYLILYRRYVTFGFCKDVLDIAIEYFFRFPRFGICETKIKN